MRLIVLIPTTFRSQLLERTLTSLSQCRIPREYDRTIVIENGPLAGAEDIVRSMESQMCVEYRYSPVPNKSLALNSVLEDLTDELVVFFDDDVRVSPGILEAYVQSAYQSAHRVFFGGPLEVDYEVEPEAWLKRRLPLTASGWNISQAEDKDRPIFLGPNWAAYADDMKRVKGFDVDRGPGALTGSTGQETDMQVRLYADGCQGKYVPEALLWHYVPVHRCSPKWTLQRAYRNGVAHGLDLEDSSARLFGMPRWMLRKWLSDWISYLRTRMCRNAEKRFLAARDLRWITGVLKGTRIAHQEG